MERDYFEEERYIMAQKKVKAIKGFYWHLFWYLAVNIFLWVPIYSSLDSDEGFFQFGHFATAFFWGIGLFFHWLGVFGKNIFFSKDWEKRKMKEYMDQDLHNFEE
ncbi:MAG: 2TM domain-containing protein [Flavobacteriaceae bacterium]|nr:2TM domain-containing protein [Flavobacteriaceae bacterium]